MKRLLLLNAFLLCSFIGFAQITDENGVSATGVLNQQLTGKIGVGTFSPSSELDVNGTVTSKTTLVINTQPDGSVFSNSLDRNNQCRLLGLGETVSPNTHLFNLFDFPVSNLDAKSKVHLGVDDRSEHSRWRFVAYTGGNSYLRYYDKTQSMFYQLSEDGSSNVHLQMPKENSYLTIGTTSFSDNGELYKLTVNGKVRAHGVKVYTDWADFVFEKNYDLMPLEEVEAYIKEHGHLKDIPSAEEVKENGIEVGEMNKLLLQKIEELTLYTIELKKEIEKLKKE